MWSLYAWPITVLVLWSDLFTVGHSDILKYMDLLITGPALVGIHLYTWDKQCLPNCLWKFYAFAYVGWDVAYNLVFKPLHTGQKPGFDVLLGFIILFPLYFGLFKCIRVANPV
jgi:hypothetical protein